MSLNCCQFIWFRLQVTGSDYMIVIPAKAGILARLLDVAMTDLRASRRHIDDSPLCASQGGETLITQYSSTLL